MSATALVNIGLNAFWALGEDAWKTGMDTNLVFIDALLQAGVVAVGTSAPPGSPSQGEAHIIDAASPSGVFSGHGNGFAVYYGTAWYITAPREGWMVFDRALNRWWLFDGTDWTDNLLSFIARPVKDVTAASYTLVMADAARFLQLSDASGVALLIPKNSDVPLPIGTEVPICQADAGAVTVAGDTGVTVLARGGADQTAGQEAVAHLKKVAANTWRLYGDIN